MYDKELRLAVQAAQDAAAFLQTRTSIHVDSFAGKDIKLSSDKASEAIIIQHLSQSGIPILSEEAGRNGMGELLWVVDPIDGTMNYYKGLEELACVSIALLKGSQPVLGVIRRLGINELYTGVVGEGAFLNDAPIKPSAVTRTADAVLATGFPLQYDYATESIAGFVKSVQCFKKVRMLGAAALMNVMVAAGKIDVYTENNIMLWDIAAASAIVTAAGGVVDLDCMGANRCVCRAFANMELREDFYAKGL